MSNTVPDSQLEFDLGEGEQETLIEVPEQEAPESEVQEVSTSSPAPAATKKEEALGQELDAVSENVQKRIAKLTAKMREAERREQAAIEYARSVQAKSQELERQLTVTDTSRLQEAKSRMDTETATLKAIIRRAREENDIDTETEAQERLMQLTFEQRRVSDHLQSRASQEEVQQTRQAQVQQPVQQPAQQRRAPSPKAEDWARKNEWFGKDKTMTYAAWGIHATMVEEEGFDPESDEYYTELDNRIRAEFPQKFGSYYSKSAETTSRQRQNVPAVAPASRSSGVNSARKTVKLSPSQVAIAKKLGVPLEEYAKHVKE
jgi:hypothetical protein